MQFTGLLENPYRNAGSLGMFDNVMNGFFENDNRYCAVAPSKRRVIQLACLRHSRRSGQCLWFGKQLAGHGPHAFDEFFGGVVIGVECPDRIAQGVDGILGIGLNLFQNRCDFGTDQVPIFSERVWLRSRCW